MLEIAFELAAHDPTYEELAANYAMEFVLIALMNLFEVAHEIVNRLTWMFLRDESGRRPVFGGAEKFQRDPNWRDNLLFYEYFHGDNGAGIGASHQTGWTGVIAGLIDIFGKLDAETFLQGGREAAFGQEKTV
jgi:hypothetical protein